MLANVKMLNVEEAKKALAEGKFLSNDSMPKGVWIRQHQDHPDLLVTQSNNCITAHSQFGMLDSKPFTKWFEVELFENTQMEIHELNVNQITKHVKTGKHYVVLMLTNIETSDSSKFPVTVVYRCLETGNVWSRPFSEFSSKFSITSAKPLGVKS